MCHCDSVVQRAQLEELVLYGNPLESLPAELFALSRLHTLRISAREFAETAHLDAHTEQLIARNQLHSVHIPNVIFELPALRSLDLTGAPRCAALHCIARYLPPLPPQACLPDGFRGAELLCNKNAYAPHSWGFV